MGCGPLQGQHRTTTTACSKELRVRSVRQGEVRYDECTFLQLDGRFGLYFRRRFFVYGPTNHRRVRSKRAYSGSGGPGAPVVCLFHGSHSSGMLSSMYTQFMSGNSRGWQDVAEREGLLLVFMESLPEPEPRSLSVLAGEQAAWREQLKAAGFDLSDCDGCWRPGPRDRDYVDAVLEHVEQMYWIDRAQLLAVGHSNGGLFLADVVSTGDHPFAAVVNHMGGLEPEPTPDERRALAEAGLSASSRAAVAAEQQRRVPMLIVTAPRDDNRGLCSSAHGEFAARQWPVCLYQFAADHLQRHGYSLESVAVCWAFYCHCRRRGLLPLPAHSVTDAQRSDFLDAVDWQSLLSACELDPPSALLLSAHNDDDDGERRPASSAT